jgi:alanyl-tRNA synthetase
VDGERRDAIRANHTATHLLHQALKEALGDHVAQAGSYVGPDRLRFDISHPSGVADAEIHAVENAVNARIARNSAVVTTIESPEDAKARGATALFGEKYGEEVRVVSIDDDGGARQPWSLELCGGTHVERTGQIGPFVIVAERAVAAGVRRLEALTAQGAVAAFQEQRRLLKELSVHLKTAPEELTARVQQLQKQVKDAKKQKKSAAGDHVAAAFKTAKDTLQPLAGVHVGALDVSELDRDGVRQLGDRLKGAMPNLAVVVFGRGTPGDDGSGVPFVALCQGSALEKGLQAGVLASVVKGCLGGGGGGRPESAQGQGERADAVPAAIQALGEHFGEQLG